MTAYSERLSRVHLGAAQCDRSLLLLVTKQLHRVKLVKGFTYLSVILPSES